MTSTRVATSLQAEKAAKRLRLIGDPGSTTAEKVSTAAIGENTPLLHALAALTPI